MAKKKTQDQPTPPPAPEPPVKDGATSFDETPGDSTVSASGQIEDRKEPGEFEQSPSPEPEQPTRAPDNAQVAPEAGAAAEFSSVYLPRLVADEYGMAEANAVSAVLEAITIKLDEEEWTGDRRWIPYNAIVGKQVTIVGPVRSVRFTYAG